MAKDVNTRPKSDGSAMPKEMVVTEEPSVAVDSKADSASRELNGKDSPGLEDKDDIVYVKGHPVIKTGTHYILLDRQGYAVNTSL